MGGESNSGTSIAGRLRRGGVSMRPGGFGVAPADVGRSRRLTRGTRWSVNAAGDFVTRRRRG